MAVKVCTIEGCDRPVLARGWCSRHYDRWKRYGDPEDGGPIQPRRVRGARVGPLQPSAVPVLHCATPEEYWLWLGRKGEPPAAIEYPLASFCRDAERAWCEEQRAAGLCCRTAAEFARLKDITQQGDDEDEEVAVAIEWDMWRGGVGSGDPVVTISRNGALRLNAAADRLLGEPEAVQLLIAQGARLIGMRTARPTDESAIPVRRKEGEGGLLITCKPFFLFHRIPLDETRRYRVQCVDGVLVLDRNAEPLAIPGRAA